MEEAQVQNGKRKSLDESGYHLEQDVKKMKADDTLILLQDVKVEEHSEEEVERDPFHCSDEDDSDEEEDDDSDTDEMGDDEEKGKTDEELENGLAPVGLDPQEGAIYNGIQQMISAEVLQNYSAMYGNNASNDLQCKSCLKIFARKSYLRGHQCSQDLNINNKALECQYCNRRYSHKINLRLHLKLHKNPKQFQCNICLKYLSSSSSLKVHVKTHNSEKPFPCDSCSLSFNQKVHLNDHILSHHAKVRPFHCSLCNKTYISKSVLKKHLKKHFGLFRHECEICSKRFFEKSALKKHMRTHSSDLPLNKLKSDDPMQCHYCLTYFHFRYKMITHLMVEHEFNHINEQCIQCPLCDLKFNIIENETSIIDESDQVEKKEDEHVDIVQPSSEDDPLNESKNIISKLKILRDNLKNIVSEHIKSHEYVEHHVCEICYKTFESKDNLVRHMKIHENKDRRRFQCEYCEKSFTVNADLNRHIRSTHDKIKPYECEICGKFFSQRNNLKRHLDEVHRNHGLTFECYICKKLLATAHSLKRHLLIHNGPKYCCDLCPREFTRVYELNVHKKMHESVSDSNELKCKSCDKFFIKKSNLRAHIENKHLDYTCLECQAEDVEVTFPKKKLLLTHLRTKHKNVISNVYLTCLLCLRSFLNESDLKRHIRKFHSQENQQQCAHCEKTCTSHHELNQHMKNAHNIDMSMIEVESENENSEEEDDVEPEEEENEEGNEVSMTDTKPVDLKNLVDMDIKIKNGLGQPALFNQKLTDNFMDSKKRLDQPALFNNKVADNFMDFRNGVDQHALTNNKVANSFTFNHALALQLAQFNSEISLTRVTEKVDCTICNQSFDSEQSLKNHIIRVHGESNDFKYNHDELSIEIIPEKDVIQCPECRKTFTRKDSLKKHMKIYHPSPELQQSPVMHHNPIDQVSFANQLGLKLPPGITLENMSITPHTDNNLTNLLNPQIEMQEGNEDELQFGSDEESEDMGSQGTSKGSHLLEVILNEGASQENSIIECKICAKTFTRKDSLRKHMSRFHHMSPFDPIEKTESTEGETNRNMLEVILEQSGHEFKSRIPCDLCYKTFTRKDSLRKHMRIFHTRRNLMNGENGLDAIDGTKIPCALCDKSFTRKDSLRKHIKIFHTQNQNHDEDFLNIVLNEGIRTHEKLIRNTPFSDRIRCDICDKTFTRKDSLYKHNKIFHSELNHSASSSQDGMNYTEDGVMHDTKDGIMNDTKDGIMNHNKDVIMMDTKNINMKGAEGDLKDAEDSDENEVENSASFLQVVVKEEKKDIDAVDVSQQQRLSNIISNNTINRNADIICRICNKSFTRNYNLKKHMKGVHKIDQDVKNPLYNLKISQAIYQQALLYQQQQAAAAIGDFGSLSDSMLQVIMTENE